MARLNRKVAFLATLILSSLFVSSVAAVEFDFCAGENTGGGDPDSTNNANSQGACIDTCKFEYAYAITQFTSCWCSNFKPAKELSRGSCNTPCPGYPFEKCGGDNNAFSYKIVNADKVEGTKGASGPTTTKSTSNPPPPPSSTSSTDSSSSISTTSSPSTTSAKPSTSAVSTVTRDGGSVVTVFTTVTPTVNPNDSANTPVDANKKSGLGTGAIVGIVVGVVVGLAAIGCLIWFILGRRRRQNEENEYREDSSVRGSGSRHGRGSPSSPGSAGNRSSMLQVDPRMDPFQQGLYARSGSTESVNTLRDDHDYSRRIQQPKVLRATNPDPENA